MRLPRFFLLDTTTIVALARRGDLGRYLTSHYPELLLPPSQSPITISYVTLAESLSLASRNGWGQQKIDYLRSLLDGFRVVTIDSAGILEAYIEIEGYSLDLGRTLGKNDLWIAATASATNATLLTSDRDFDHLDPVYLSRIWIDPASTL